MTDQLDLYDKPGHIIRRCHQISVSIFAAECKEFDISPRQYGVLAVTGKRPGVDQVTLAGLVALDSASTGSVIARLEKRGLIERQPDELDKRFRRVFLTDRGRALLEAVNPSVDRAQERILAPLTPSERETFVRLVIKLANRNNEYSRAPLREDRKREDRAQPR